MDLEQFLELFEPRPGNHYLQVTTKVDETTLALEQLMKEVDGEMRVAYYSSSPITEKLTATVQEIQNFKIPFRALPRDNDLVVLKDILFLHQDPKLLLKISYSTLANNANIILMEKKGTMDIEKILELLEEFEFRSGNYIDILPEYDLIIAKKLHMWGNGL